MRSSWLLGAVLCTGLAAGCGGDDGSSPDDDGPTPLAEAVIDDAGGALVAGSIALTVPAGALDEATELAILPDDTDHPDGDPQPVYGLAGLPPALGESLTLRIAYGGTGDGDEPPTVWLGEERECTSGGATFSWFATDVADSAGWCIATIDEGPLNLADKARSLLRVTVSESQRVLTRDTPEERRFTVYYDPAAVSDEGADWVLLNFETWWGHIRDLGFTFGDGASAYPQAVHLRMPASNVVGEYVAAAHGRGHFNLNPAFGAPGSPVATVAAHEIFHSAQDFHDPRDPAQWGRLNAARLWLDEATASFVEALASGDEMAYVPIGFGGTNYLAPTLGIGGPLGSDAREHGYGMFSFIRSLVAAQGEDRLLEIYQAFRTHGTAPAALAGVMGPPLETWCVDFQRDLVLGRLTPHDVNGEFALGYAPATSLGAAVGAEAAAQVEVRDFGSGILMVDPADATPPDDAAIKVRVAPARGRRDDSLTLIGYGVPAVGQPELLAEAAADSLLLADAAGLYARYEYLLVQLVNPAGAGPAYDGLADHVVRLEMVEQRDLSRFETFSSYTRYHAFWSGHGEVPWQGLGFSSDLGAWDGDLYVAEWDDDDGGTRKIGTITATVDLETLELLSWSGEELWDQPGAGDQRTYRIECSGRVPLDDQQADALVYRLDDAAVCDFVDAIAVTIWEDGVVTDQLVDWTCDADSYMNVYLRDER